MERSHELRIGNVRQHVETLKGEGFKTAAEIALSGLGRSRLGGRMLEFYAFGMEGRVADPALHTSFAGIKLENPVMVGAGWDKKGRALHGLHWLGFSAEEVGTVPLLGQPGNPRPRLWTLDPRHSVGFNRLGFNSPGAEAVETYLKAQRPFPCPVGINVGKNKKIPDSLSPWAHGEVVKQLYRYADYFVFNPSSPNTPDLRNLQAREPLRQHLAAMYAAMDECGGRKPLLAKFAPDLTRSQLEEALEVLVEMGASGIILVNTTVSPAILAKYGRQGQPGGLSGNEWEYRSVALRMVYEAYEMAGDRLDIIGVGAISSAEHAIERMLAGASAVQVVTAIRQQNGRSAAVINRGILDWMHRHGVKNITEIIGAATRRGTKYGTTGG